MAITQKKEKYDLSNEKEFIRFMGEISIFSKLTKSERMNLKKYIYLRTFKPGEVVFKKGYPNVVFYIVQEGLLKVYLEKDGREIVLSKLHSFDFFGEMGLFLEEYRTASIAAIEESKLIAISKRDLADFIAKFPRAGTKILYKFGELLSRNILKTNNRISEG
ncbi:MAG: cyclic nucleotide-binding domain-containing protein [Candidatus Cloacimonetes bacterium]|nr:cyclic nucleotide-binding domain-containing protein [Candidatus Cloacimonadota bacterium]